MNKGMIILGLLATTVLAGCQVEKRVYEHGNTARAEGAAIAATAAQPFAPADVSPIKVRDDIFVGSKAVRNENGDPLPAKLERPNGVTIVRTAPSPLQEIATTITETTKIPVVVSMTAPSGQSGGGSAPGAPGGGNAVIGAPVAQGDLKQALSALGAPGTGEGILAAPNLAPAGMLALNYTGKLSGLLDMIAAHFNVAWKHEGGRIVITSVVTRSFDVPALPIIANLTFDLTSKSETRGETSSTEAGQSAQTKSATDVWKEMETTLKSLASPWAVNVNTTSGVVTVTGDPATVARVGEYIKSMNERLGQQVAISVKVYSLTLDDHESFDLNVGGLFRGGKNGLSFGNKAPVTEAGGVVPIPGISEVAGAGGLGWALLDTSSRFAGSNGLMDALSKRGDVSVVTSASVTTVNGIPVPLQVGSLRDYVKSVRTTTTDQGTETTVETGSVTTGFNLHLVPRVDRGGTLMLQYGINLSELMGANDGFDTRDVRGVELQLRRLNQRNFIQQAKIPNGNTLVLAGFEQVRSSSKKTGVGHYNFPLLGGSREAKMQREIVVIAITPTLLDLNKK